MWVGFAPNERLGGFLPSANVATLRLWKMSRRAQMAVATSPATDCALTLRWLVRRMSEPCSAMPKRDHMGAFRQSATPITAGGYQLRTDATIGSHAGHSYLALIS